MQFIKDAATDEENAGKSPYTPDAMASIFAALFDKIHPLAIGAIEQSYALSKFAARRCLETHMTGDGEQEDIDKIVDRLCDDYKSHAYQIGRREAKSIGLKVRPPSDDEDAALADLLKFYSARPPGPFGCIPKPGQQSIPAVLRCGGRSVIVSPDPRQSLRPCESHVPVVPENSGIFRIKTFDRGHPAT